MKIYPISSKIVRTGDLSKTVLRALEGAFEKNFEGKIERVKWTKETEGHFCNLEMKLANKPQSIYAFLMLSTQDARTKFAAH